MRRIGFGLILALIGTWAWVSNLGVDGYFSFHRSWPVLIVLFGVWLVVRAIRFAVRHRGLRSKDVIRDLERGRIDVDEALARLRCAGR